MSEPTRGNAARTLTVMQAHLAADCPDRATCWAKDIHDAHDPALCCRERPEGGLDGPCTWPETDCYQNGPAMSADPKGPLGYGRYDDDPSCVGCPRAQSDMTPCVARDGDTACADDGTCVGCSQHPASLLTELVRAVTEPTDGT